MAEYIRARSEDQKEERLNQIKDATAKLFETQPFNEITLSTIAEKLGWSRANLYKYVTTKEEIIPGRSPLKLNPLFFVTSSEKTVAASGVPNNAEKTLLIPEVTIIFMLCLSCFNTCPAL